MLGSSFRISVDAIASLFTMMALGYAAKRFLKLENNALKQFNTLVFYVFLPVMLFNSLRTPGDRGGTAPKLAVYTIGVLLLLIAVTWMAVLRLECANEKRGVMIQACFRSNLLLLGIPLVKELCPNADTAAASVLVALVVPTFNVLATVTLEAFSREDIQLRRVLAGILRNPLIVASILGVAASTLHLSMPGFLDKAATQIASASSPAALVLLGAQFEFRDLSGQARNLTIIAVCRLLLYPAVGLIFGTLLGFRGAEFAVLIPTFAAPTAINSYNMACQMGGDAGLAASAVTVTTLLSAFSMLLWIFIFKTLGMF